jgi:spermidine synthase
VARHPVEQIDVVEISPVVLRTADAYFGFINHGVLGDPRVRVVVNDGRNYLLATTTSYDAILSDSIHPVFAGNSALYTEEYFELCRRRLEPGGVVSMWLPLYSLDSESFLRILAAFHRVFPHTTVWYDMRTVNENTVVTGQVSGGGDGKVRLRWQMLGDPEVARSLAIARVDGARAMATNLLLGPHEVAALVARVQPHEDDLPFVEYTAGRLLARERTWAENLRMVASMRCRANPFADLPVPWQEVVEERDWRLDDILRKVAAAVDAGSPDDARGVMDTSG